MSHYLAKTYGKEQSIEDHVQEVYAQFEEIVRMYPKAFTTEQIELIRLACLIHDLGKVNDKFQTKIRKHEKTIEGEITHGLLSVLFLDFKEMKKRKYSEAQALALATAIMYHHTRSFEVTLEEVEEYVKKYMEKPAAELMSQLTFDFANPRQRLFPQNIKRRLFTYQTQTKQVVSYEGWLEYLTIKGMLNKADYAASNSKNIPIEIPHPQVLEDQLAYKIRKEVQSFAPGKPVEEILYPAQRFLAENAGENVILIAPAGSGKTEGSLLWLGERKGFYTLPLKVSTNAIYDRVIDRYQFPDVALLHSDSLSLQLNNERDVLTDQEKIARYDVMKSLAYPLTICTVDQIFKFVFKALGTEILAATLKYSCVIIDEIQMYSPKLMAYLCYGLKVVNDLGGKFLIMTATLPQMVTDYFSKQGITFKEKEFADLNSGSRHRITLAGTHFNFDLILSQAQEKKVLILCNTVKQAQSVYFTLKDRLEKEGSSTPIRLLHSRFIKKDRRQLEDEILSFAKNGGSNKEPGIWISTQIVEASVDIDFDFLHTEMCTIDSLFQRMGRCYRSRPYDGAEPNIFIYNTENGKARRTLTGEMIGIYDADLYEYSLDEIEAYEGQALTEDDKMNMVRRVFDLKRLEGKPYLNSFNEAIKALESLQPGLLTKQKADELFREIKNVTVMPKRIYEENQALIDEAIGVLRDPETPMAKRLEARDVILDHCVSLSMHNHRFPPGINKEPLCSDSRVIPFHLTESDKDYDFDGKTGAGLTGEIKEDSAFDNTTEEETGEN